MGYYNRNGEKINLRLKDMKYLDCGRCAEVFYDSEFIFKRYFTSTDKNLRMTSSSFDFLKSVNNPHFVQLYDIYTEYSLFEFFRSKFKGIPFKIDAYTAKYYPDDSVNILHENKNYILDNFRELEALFDIFSNENVLVHDASRKNAILSKNGIVLIDPDLFLVNPDLYKLFGDVGDEIYPMIIRDFSFTIRNKKKLLFLFKNLLINASSRGVEQDNFLDDDLLSLFDFEITNDTEVSYEISKVLKNVQKPIDFFTKASNNIK